MIWGEATITSPARSWSPRRKSLRCSRRTRCPKAFWATGTYQAKNIIVATGARPRVLPGLEPDGKLIWTYFEAMVPEQFPKSLIVIGSGAIGIEFASFYRTMGAEVTRRRSAAANSARRGCRDRGACAQAVREAGHQDPDLGQGRRRSRKRPDGVVATIEDDKGATQTLKAERMISAVGVVGNVENLGLEALGVKIERGIIVTDGLGAHQCAGIYAIGDVAGPPMLAHKAEHEGRHLRRGDQGPASASDGQAR